jgi:hypothetical protein
MFTKNPKTFDFTSQFRALQKICWWGGGIKSTNKNIVSHKFGVVKWAAKNFFFINIYAKSCKFFCRNFTKSAKFMKTARFIKVAKIRIKQAKIRTNQQKFAQSKQKFANFLPQIQTKSLTIFIVSHEFGVVKWAAKNFFFIKKRKNSAKK